MPAPPDLYRAYRFRVVMSGVPVAGFVRAAGLGASVVTASPGAADIRAPSVSKYQPITLERGITYDSAFEDWCNLVWARDARLARVLADFHKDLTIETYDEAGRRQRAFHLVKCWPSEFQSMPELDANASAIAIRHLVLQNEGFVRNDADG